MFVLKVMTGIVFFIRIYNLFPGLLCYFHIITSFVLYVQIHCTYPINFILIKNVCLVVVQKIYEALRCIVLLLNRYIYFFRNMHLFKLYGKFVKVVVLFYYSFCPLIMDCKLTTTFHE